VRRIIKSEFLTQLPAAVHCQLFDQVGPGSFNQYSLTLSAHSLQASGQFFKVLTLSLCFGDVRQKTATFLPGMQ